MPGTRSPRSFARTTAVRAPGKNSIAPTWTRRCDPDHRHALTPGPSPVLRVWPAMDGRDPRPPPVPRAAGGRGSPWCGGSVPAACHSTPARLPPSSNRSPVRNPDARPRAPALACHWCHSGGTVHPGHPDPPVRSSLADKRHIGARMGRLTARSRTPAARKLPGAPGKRPDSQEINGTMHEGQNMPGTLCA